MSTFDWDHLNNYTINSLKQQCKTEGFVLPKGARKKAEIIQFMSDEHAKSVQN